MPKTLWSNVLPAAFSVRAMRVIIIQLQAKAGWAQGTFIFVCSRRNQTWLWRSHTNEGKLHLSVTCICFLPHSAAPDSTCSTWQAELPVCITFPDKSPNKVNLVCWQTRSEYLLSSTVANVQWHGPWICWENSTSRVQSPESSVPACPALWHSPGSTCSYTFPTATGAHGFALLLPQGCFRGFGFFHLFSCSSVTLVVCVYYELFLYRISTPSIRIVFSVISSASLEIHQTDVVLFKAPGSPVPSWAAGCAVWAGWCRCRGHRITNTQLSKREKYCPNVPAEFWYLKKQTGYWENVGHLGTLHVLLLKGIITHISINHFKNQRGLKCFSQSFGSSTASSVNNRIWECNFCSLRTAGDVKHLSSHLTHTPICGYRTPWEQNQDFAATEGWEQHYGEKAQKPLAHKRKGVLLRTEVLVCVQGAALTQLK